MVVEALLAVKRMEVTAIVAVFNFTINRLVRVNYFGQEHVDEPTPHEFWKSIMITFTPFNFFYSFVVTLSWINRKNSGKESWPSVALKDHQWHTYFMFKDYRTDLIGFPEPKTPLLIRSNQNFANGNWWFRLGKNGRCAIFTKVNLCKCYL